MDKFIAWIAELVDVTHEAIILVDAAQKITAFNKGAEKIFGHGAADVINRPLDILLPEEYRIVHRNHIDAFGRSSGISRQMDVRGEILGLRKDGETFPCEATIMKLHRSEEIMYAVILRDISARRESERALYESEAQLRLIMDALPVLTACLDRDLRYVTINKTGAEWYGMAVEEIIGKRPKDIFKSLPVGWQKRYEGVLRGQQITTDRRITYPDGVTRDVRISYLPRINSDHRVTGFYILAEDFTKRKETENINANFGRMTEDSLNEIYMFDSETLLFKVVNRGARENLGYSNTELLKMTPLDIKPAYNRESFLQLLEPLRAGAQEFIDFETVHCRKDRSTYDVRVRLQLTRFEYPAVYIANAMDITEKKLFEQRNRHTQKMESIGQVTAGVAHEFNNLLMATTGHIEWLLAGNLNNPGEIREQLETILKSVFKGKDLTHRLLSYTGNPFGRPEILNAAESIVNSARFLRPMLGEMITVETRMADNLWPIRVDSGEFETAIVNLVINARDAMSDGGKITIMSANATLDAAFMARQEASVMPGDYLYVSVSDTGIGMAPDVKARAFDPFFTTKEVGKGTGLGLSMVYGFVHQQSGGFVNIDSEEKCGTTVTMYFPRANAVRQPEKMHAEAYAFKGQNVLMVEDSPEVSQSLAYLLESLNFNVFSAVNGPDAREILNSPQKVDLLLTDAVLPGGTSGFELADYVRRSFPDIKIILASGYSEEALVTKGLSVGRYPLLTKPFRQSELVVALEKVFAADNATQY